MEDLEGFPFFQLARPGTNLLFLSLCGAARETLGMLRSHLMGVLNSLNVKFQYSVFKLTGDQEDEYFSAESDNNMSTLDSDAEADLEQQLNRNHRTIITQYANYVDCILTIVKDRVTADQLGTYLLSLRAFKGPGEEKMLCDLRAEIENAESVYKIFNLLNTKYASFLDYEIFQSILNRYGENETHEELNYPAYLKAYME